MLTNHYYVHYFLPPEILLTMVWGWYYHASFTDENETGGEINLLKRHKQLSGFSSGGFMAVSFWPLTAAASQREWTDEWTRVDESSRQWWSLRKLTSSFLHAWPQSFLCKVHWHYFCSTICPTDCFRAIVLYLQQTINLRSALTGMAASTYMLLLSTWNEACLRLVVL